MTDESVDQRRERILNELKSKYPGKAAWDVDGRGLHLVCEVEPVSEHPEFDRTIEVIIASQPHKHLKMTQEYTIISGALKLIVDEESKTLKQGDKYTVEPGKIHSAASEDGGECWVEIYSRPGWTREDHIIVS